MCLCSISVARRRLPQSDVLTPTHIGLWLLETCPPLSSCGPLSDCQSEWCQRCTDQRCHWFAEFIQAVGVDHPAARPAVSGLPQTLPPLHPCPAQTGNRLSLVHLTSLITMFLVARSWVFIFPCLYLQKSFRTGTSTRLDDRVFAMCQLKYQPLAYAMLMVHPALYRVDDLNDEVSEEAASLTEN